jgi:hypothetical protein
VLVGTTLAFAVVGAVGATLGAVGAVTKNKTLGYIGMGLGAIGAVGGLASAAGVFAEGGLFSSAASTGAGAGAEGVAIEGGWTPNIGDAATGPALEPLVESGPPASAAEVAASVDQGAWDTTVPVSGTSMQYQPKDLTTLETTTEPQPNATATGTYDQEGNLIADGKVAPGNTVDGGGAVPGGGKAPGGEGVQYGGEGDPSLPGTPPAPPGEAGGAAASKAPAPQWGPDNSLKYTENPNAPGSGTLSPKTGLDKIGDVFSSVAEWAEKHKVLSQGMMTGASALIGGLKPTTTEAQVNSMNAAAEANSALAKMREQQIANIAAPKAVAFSPPVTGTPAQNAWGYASPGLINRAPTANVTGAAA